MYYQVDEIAQILGNLQDRSYVVEAYTVSLKQLVIAIYPRRVEESPLFITFRTVMYMRLHPYWENTVFRLGSPDLCRELLTSVGESLSDNLPYLFYVMDGKLLVQVLCRSIWLTDKKPDL